MAKDVHSVLENIVATEGGKTEKVMVLLSVEYLQLEGCC